MGTPFEDGKFPLLVNLVREVQTPWMHSYLIELSPALLLDSCSLLSVCLSLLGCRASEGDGGLLNPSHSSINGNEDDTILETSQPFKGYFSLTCSQVVFTVSNEQVVSLKSSLWYWTDAVAFVVSLLCSAPLCLYSAVGPGYWAGGY